MCVSVTYVVAPKHFTVEEGKNEGVLSLSKMRNELVFSVEGGETALPG